MGRTRWLWVATALAVFAASAARAGAEEIVLAVDADRVLRDGADRFVGINLNYIRDLDSNRPGARPLNEALKDLGVRWLRYPGGEKSDFYLWSQPPYAKPAPMSLLSYAKHAGDRMDFDAYIACCRAVGAESLVVVGCDNEKRTGRTWDQWLENAVTWVRYAKEKKCGVRYWEIGNENWHNQTAPAEEMAKIVARFSKAMKEADPSILTGASLSGDDKWNAPILAGAGPQLDFVTVSVYNTSGWKIYDYFPKHPDANLRQTAATALKAIDRFAAPADRARLKVIVSEMNSKDFAKDGAWPATNTLGHALVTFETFGRLMQEPRIASTMLWTTRWMNDADATTSQWYGLGPANEIKPAGRAVAMWGQFVREKLIAVDGGTPLVGAYASRSADGRQLTVWVVNRGLGHTGEVKVAVRSPATFRTATLYRFSGQGPDDTNPQWKTLDPETVTDNAFSVRWCPAVSVTVITLQP